MPSALLAALKAAPEYKASLLTMRRQTESVSCLEPFEWGICLLSSQTQLVKASFHVSDAAYA